MGDIVPRVVLGTFGKQCYFTDAPWRIFRKMYYILVYSDDHILSQGAAYLLQTAEDLQLAYICPDSSQLIKELRTRQPHVLLLDISPDINLALISDVRKAVPDCRVILWGRDVPHELSYQAMAMGIRGVLDRTLPAADLISCIRKVASNDVWFDEALTSGFFCNRVTKLTRRESQLVTLLARGMKNKEIAYLLSLSEGTVKVYLSRLFEKVGVKDRFELALYGLRNFSSLGSFGTENGAFSEGEPARPLRSQGEADPSIAC
jgi:DNA-binding NarL/FixJ family response regulator